VRIQQNGKQFVIFYMAGFVIGILCANIVIKNYLMTSGTFSEYYLNQYVNTSIIVEEYVLYILKIRLLPLAGLALLGCTKLRKAAAVGGIAWTGLLSGLILVEAIMKLGVKGIILCLLAITPQFLFYILAYCLVFWSLYTYPKTQWNVKKTVFVVLTVGVGIILEGYVNPIIMKMFIRIL